MALSRSLRLRAISYRKTHELKVYQRELRTAKAAHIVALEAALRNYGMVLPLLVNRDDVLLSGEKLWKAASNLGLEEVPTLCIEHLDDDQERYLRIALNKLSEGGEWNNLELTAEFGELILNETLPPEMSGFSMAEIDLRLDGPAANDQPDPADLAPPLEAKAVSKLGDLWTLCDHRLVCGSALEDETYRLLMPDHDADAVFCDSPYDVPITGHVSGKGRIKHREFVQGSGELGREGFTEFQKICMSLIADHCRDGSIIFTCMDHRHVREMLAGIDKAGLDLINIAVWDKQTGGMGSLYRSQYELIFVSKKGKSAHINNVQLGKFGRNRNNIWPYPGMNSFGRDRQSLLALHPTCKPVQMVKDAIMDVTHRRNVILDPFLGSGTTLIACEKSGRVCRGADLDPLYIDVSIRRWQALTGRPALLSETGETFAQLEAKRRDVADKPLCAVAADDRLNPPPRRRAI